MGRFEAIYARQSVDKKESVSIEAQIDDCKRLAGNNIKIYKDKGFSGKNTERPELKQLIRDIEAGLIQKVIVYKLDRISRNITDFYKLYEIMSSNDCEFISWTEHFDTTSTMGRAMMGILAVFAQMERENIQTRIKDNYAYRIKDGRWASGKAPFGFRNGKVDNKATLLPVKDEIEIVKWMFKTYAESPNISLGQIQSKLIEKGFKGKQSEKGFSRTTINHILTNPVYVRADELLYQYYQKKLIEFVNPIESWNGEFSAAIVGKNNRSLNNKDLSGIRVYITNVQGVIDSRTFIMVQERLAQNSAIASDNSPNTNLKELAGLLKCAECKSAIKMQKYPTLTCNGRNQLKICDVSFKGLRLETIQENVDEEIGKYLLSLKRTRLEKESNQKKIKRKIADLEKQFNNLLEVASFSDELSSSLKIKLDKLIVEIKELQLKLKLDNTEDIIYLRLGNTHKDLYHSIFYDGGKTKITYKDLNTEQKQTILRVLVNKIFVKNDGSVDIEYKD